jgi:hypothetical protein
LGGGSGEIVIMEREVDHEDLAMKCVDAELAQMATYVLNYIMIINSVQADFPKIHNLREASHNQMAAVKKSAATLNVNLEMEH